MTKMMIDPALQAKLRNGCERVEFTDESGQTLGMYLPAEQYERLLYRLAEAQCPYSPEQRAKFRQETGTMTLADFWKRIGRA